MFIAYSATLIDPALFNELLAKDTQLVLPTLVLQHTPLFARRLLERLRAFPILKGVRGGTPVDLDKVVDALLRLSSLVNDHPEIAEVEMNPVFARPDGVEAVDVRLRVAAR